MSQVALTRQMINSAATVRDLFEIQPVQEKFVMNYKNVTGRDNGAMIFEREKILFMKALAENKALEKCDKFSIYASFIELAVSGLTLNEQQCYIVPYGETAKFTIGWKGRLEQISRLKTVLHANEPQLVYEGDEFEIIGGDEIKVVHKINTNRPENAQITYVYFVIDFTFGKKTYVMSRAEILKIRDNYSQSYKMYSDKIKKGVKINSWELPTWVTSESEMFKKTIVKRTYKYLPKDEHLKKIEEFIRLRNGEDHEVDPPVTIPGYDVDDEQPGYNVESDTVEGHAETVEDSQRNEEDETARAMQHKRNAEKAAAEAAKNQNYYKEAF